MPKIEIERTSLIEALAHLNTVVVSISRIGSTTFDMPEMEQRKILSDFVTDWSVGPRLARVRRLLSAAFDYDELEELFGDGPHWRFDHPNPPPDAVYEPSFETDDS
jgi:hypothetical protein